MYDSQHCRLKWHHPAITSDFKHNLRKTMSPSSPTPASCRAWMLIAWGWNLWGKMEMEPSTGTFMALVCTKKSHFREKKLISGKHYQHWCIFAQHITHYCHWVVVSVVYLRKYEAFNCNRSLTLVFSFNESVAQYPCEMADFTTSVPCWLSNSETVDLTLPERKKRGRPPKKRKFEDHYLR